MFSSQILLQLVEQAVNEALNRCPEASGETRGLGVSTQLIPRRRPWPAVGSQRPVQAVSARSRIPPDMPTMAP